MTEKINFGPKPRRIRNIQSIIGRNLIWKETISSSLDDHVPSTSRLQAEIKRSASSSSLVEDSSLMKRAYQKKEHTIGLLDAYFTLHTGDIDRPAFYQSEMISNTVNPSFRSLPVPFDWVNWYDAASSLLIVRVWTRPSLPDSAGQHTEPILGYQEIQERDTRFELLIEWQVDLNALAYIGKSTLDFCYIFPENTLLFELDSGFYSAPDIKPYLTSQSKRSSLLDLELENVETSSIHTVNSMQTKQKRSYTYNNVIKLNTLLECIFDTQKSSDEVRQNIEDALDDEQKGFDLKRELNQRKTHLVEQEARILQQKRLIQKKLENLKRKQQELENRRIDLMDATGRYTIEMEDLQENETVLEKNVKMRQNIFHTLNRRKKELIADLFSIYPIEQSYDDLQQFRIRGIYLPNSVYDGQNDEMIATALGYTSHLVYMLAYYLEIPLRYPITPMSSRSTIKDPVSLINGSRDFPLYAKGVDRYRLEFGVFLLNKNIEQLMNAYGLIVIDLRHTLPNIHYFIQAILTTSVTSSPTSISVLSISSYANGGSRNNEEPSIRQNHNHLTLQPTISPQPPSPSTSTHSSNTLTHSPKPSFSYPSNSFLNSPQAMAAPAIFDAITTSSSHH